MMIHRREMIIGGIAALAIPQGATAAAQTDADKAADDFANLREQVSEDYLSGRIVLVNGWLMSEHEAARKAAAG